MVRLEVLLNLTGINLNSLNKIEKFLFLSYLLTRINQELFEVCKKYHPQYQQIIMCNLSMESTMLENKFMYLIKDILLTEEYTLEGIAKYARVPKEVIFDILAGLNINPSSILWNKLVELHSTVRSDFYQQLVMKILSEKMSKKLPL